MFTCKKGYRDVYEFDDEPTPDNKRDSEEEHGSNNDSSRQNEEASSGGHENNSQDDRNDNGDGAGREDRDNDEESGDGKYPDNGKHSEEDYEKEDEDEDDEKDENDENEDDDNENDENEDDDNGDDDNEDDDNGDVDNGDDDNEDSDEYKDSSDDDRNPASKNESSDTNTDKEDSDDTERSEFSKSKYLTEIDELKAYMSEIHVGYFKRFIKMTNIIKSIIFMPVGKPLTDGNIVMRVAVTIKYESQMLSLQHNLLGALHKMLIEIYESVSISYEKDSRLIGLTGHLNESIVSAIGTAKSISIMKYVTFCTTPMGLRTLEKSYKMLVDRMDCIILETDRIIMSVMSKPLWLEETRAWYFEVRQLLDRMELHMQDMSSSISKFRNNGEKLNSRFYPDSEESIPSKMATTRAALRRQQLANNILQVDLNDQVESEYNLINMRQLNRQHGISLARVPYHLLPNNYSNIYPSSSASNAPCTVTSLKSETQNAFYFSPQQKQQQQQQQQQQQKRQKQQRQRQQRQRRQRQRQRQRKQQQQVADDKEVLVSKRPCLQVTDEVLKKRSKNSSFNTDDSSLLK